MALIEEVCVTLTSCDFCNVLLCHPSLKREDLSITHFCFKMDWLIKD